MDLLSPSLPSYSPSWSDLPLDLLLVIRGLLHHRSDLFSFRSVCTHWRSAVPATNPCPHYLVYFLPQPGNNVDFLSTSSKTCRSIPLPFSSSHELTFLCSSSGWLVFLALDNSVHLFDPISHRSHSLPPPAKNILTAPGSRNAARSVVKLKKVVVSLGPDNAIAVASVALLQGYKGLILDERLVFCRVGKGQSWSRLNENSMGILDVIVSSNRRLFYAIGMGWELYELEVGSQVKFSRFNLWLPKHILYDPLSVNKKLSITCYRMRETAGGHLKVYGSSKSIRSGGGWFALKVDPKNLHGKGGDMDVLCEAKWRYYIPNEYKLNMYDKVFMPKISELGPNSHDENLKNLHGKKEKNGVRRIPFV